MGVAPPNAAPAADEEALTNSNSSANEASIITTQGVPSNISIVEPSKEEGAEKVNGQDGVQEFDYPDGGLRAWLVVVGGFLGSIVTWGYITSFGVYQAYYQTHQLANESASSIAWIGSLQLFFILMGSLFAGYLFDAGHHYKLVAVGSVFTIVGIFTTAECTKLWQFILAQGFCGGIGAGFIYLPCAGTLSHWFKKRRTLCFGCIASGSSIGGVIFPILLNRMFERTTFKWAVRTAGFVCLACLIGVNLLLKPRLPARKRGKLIELRHFREPTYAIFVAAIFFINMGIYVPTFQIAVYAVDQGMNPDTAFYTISILNAASTFGRLIPNIFGNKIGALNIMFGATGLAALLSFVWISVHSNAAIFIFAAFYGAASGSYVSIMPACVAVMTTKMNEIGARTSLAFGVASFASLAGPPIAGALLGYGSFVGVACFSGATVALGVVIGQFARIRLAKRIGTWRT
ncbi:MFS general substrate transporter [Cystobasidium minutum MCA 4210]|uniref:MFS general substrate transporter n=1 Tax=Cystobasidium minutum MCA 4210 TaxID=1397322 RepID=UPI0034CF1A71|eukprot:jgi/Rhomi1/210776/estExt_Genemark1.C_4_t10347